MSSAFTRVAVVQLKYHPAILMSMRSPLEDPGGVKPLLPTDVPHALAEALDALRRRIRSVYARFVLRRIQGNHPSKCVP